nr:exodeoxyribonuclease V subunit beta [secondary endosymbiont of Heteropsylla cubana]
MLSNVKKLNPLTLCLRGSKLLEASAGTGKTYTLSVLYLRLLLGLGGEAAFPRLLRIEEILVVTFTETSTKELQYRIRNNIKQFRLACIRGKSEDVLFTELLEQIQDREHAALHLLEAERQIDKAAIFTIHGFCQRVLNYSALELGVFFQYTLLDDEATLQQNMVFDFWRRHFYPLPLEVARIVHQQWEGPKKLLEDLQPYLRGELPKIFDPPELNESILSCHKRIIINIDHLKKYWREKVVNIPDILNSYKLNRRIYNSKNLACWIKKINSWSVQPTVDYYIPEELERFTSTVLAKQTIVGDPLNNAVFFSLEVFYQDRISLKKLIFVMALVKVRRDLEQEKKKRAELSFDDLLSYLDRALKGSEGKTLAQLIRSRYPVAMIDEFQDTDPQQYRIFHFTYCDKINSALLLIGDPKQAIYAFRGADIFTYIRAKNEVDSCYSLSTNWRSSPGMVNAVNRLFQNIPDPFIFREIPFIEVSSAKKNVCLKFIIKKHLQAALCIWLDSRDSVNIVEYQEYMANKCATTIRDFLCAASTGEAWLETNLGRKALQASDITILVRNSYEASLMQAALKKILISTVYLSNRDSVFDIPEALELLWIFQAILKPEKDIILRTALATNLLSVDFSVIDALNQDQDLFEAIVEEFDGYHHYWKKNGVFPMLRKIIINYRIGKNIDLNKGSTCRLADILHLGELLQEASLNIDNEHALVHWFALQIESSTTHSPNQQLRLEADQDVIKIITVHKSKGLEFPVVFLPFAADFRIQNRAVFHDRENYLLWLDLCSKEESLRLAEEERLAEDVRLLYVAVTRSIYHCSLGIAAICRGGGKKNRRSDLHLSALGYLIQKGKSGNLDDLRKQLSLLVERGGGDIRICTSSTLCMEPFIPKMIVPEKSLNSCQWSKLPSDNWRITSYTGLKQQIASVSIDLEQKVDFQFASKQEEVETLLPLTQHTFPRGIFFGKFLHTLLEKITFNKPLDEKWLRLQLMEKNIDEIWCPVILDWMKTTINVPLDNSSLSLNRLKPENQYHELKFYLSVDATVNVNELDQIFKRYDSLSLICPPLDFPHFKGMLKGFIDLIFFWKGRYYLLDYKSNWLGSESIFYNQFGIKQAMIAHRYEFQYQIYALALHRYLRHRIKQYHYSTHFGGVYYLFLRGVDINNPGNGIFFCRPDKKLIYEFDKLCVGKYNN